MCLLLSPQNGSTVAREAAFLPNTIILTLVTQILISNTFLFLTKRNQVSLGLIPCFVAEKKKIRLDLDLLVS